ncbi:MAG: tetratricopeptide repeat protein [Aureispira sp.]
MGDKNKIEGNVNNSQVNIDDETHHHHYTKKNLPKELTTTLPRFDWKQLIGREEALTTLHQNLFNHQQVVVVNGMGGLGKTAIAQGYISKYYEEYAHIAWVSFTPENDQVPTDFINAKGLLQNFEIQTEGLPLEDIFAQLMQAFKNVKEEPCLLILDNATPDLAAYYEELPNQPHWHLLATSRSTIDNFVSHELGFLSTADAITLFRKHYTRTTLEDSFLQQLVEELEHHTLTLEILAKMAQKFRYGEAKLRAALPSNLEAKITTKHSGSQQKIERITDYLCTIFEWQLKDLETNHKQLLLNFSCLPADYHAFDLLVELLVGEGGFEQHDLSACLDDLDLSGWLLSAGESYRMHRIVGEVVGRLLEFREKKIQTLLENLTNHLDLNESENTVPSFKFIPYGLSVLAALGNWTSDLIITFQSNLALSLKNNDQLSPAKQLLEKVVYYHEQTFGEEDPLTAISYSNLAGVLMELGALELAKLLLEKSIASDEKNFGITYNSIHINYANLIFILQELGNLPRAQKIAHQLVDYNEKTFGLNALPTAASYAQLATIYIELGEAQQAKGLLERAITINNQELNFRQKEGLIHSVTAAYYSDLSLALQQLGAYKEAKKILSQLIDFDEKNFGLDHSNTANSYMNLGVLLWELEEFKTAKALLERSVQINEKVFGKDHHHTGRSYANLALVMQDLGALKKAKNLFEQAIAIDIKTYGPNHVSTATNQYGLANVFWEVEEYKLALQYMETAHKTLSNHLPYDHPRLQSVAEALQLLINEINNDNNDNKKSIPIL